MRSFSLLNYFEISISNRRNSSWDMILLGFAIQFMFFLYCLIPKEIITLKYIDQFMIVQYYQNSMQIYDFFFF